jgi:hypothetical protein
VLEIHFPDTFYRYNQKFDIYLENVSGKGGLKCSRYKKKFFDGI